LFRQFETAAGAQRALDYLKAQRKALDDAYPIKPGWGDAETMERLVKPGPRGAESAQALVSEIGNQPKAMEATKDYLAWKLRDMAEVRQGPNAGTLDVGAYNRFRRAYDPFLSHPAMADVRASFDTAAKAQAALDKSVADHTAATADYERSAAKPFLGGVNPVDAIRSALTGRQNMSQMRQLAALTASDPVARAGLQRFAVDFIEREFLGNGLAGGTDTRQIKSDRFQTFVRKSSDALGQIFSPEQVRSIQAVAADLQRSARPTQLPGRSNTAQDLAGGVKHGGSRISTLGMLLLAERAGEMLERATGPVGKLVGLIGVPLLNHLRNAGIDHINNLTTEAMLNPELARVLVNRHLAAQPPTPQTGRILASRILATMANAAATAPNVGQQRQQPVAPPPRSVPASRPMPTPVQQPPRPQGLGAPPQAASGIAAANAQWQQLQRQP